MPSRAELIRQATEAARDDWYNYTSRQESEILAIFRQAAEEVGAAIAKLSDGDEIRRTRLQTLLGQIEAEKQRLNVSLSAKIRTSMSNSIDLGIKASIFSMQRAGLYGGNRPDDPARVNVQPGRGPVKVHVGTSYTAANGKIVRYDSKVELFANSQWAKINGHAMDHLLRFRPNGLTLSQSVWDITYKHERFMRRQVTQAVLQGRSAAALSQELRSSLREPNRLFRRVRGSDGKLRWSRAAREYHPGQGVYRSAYKNAMRLARTEMNRAYHEGGGRYAKTKEWIDGAIWRLGNIDACPICVDLADKFYPKGSIPLIPHPHCMCHLEWHIEGDEKPAEGETDPKKLAKRAADALANQSQNG